jgi:thiamine pyrophosphate-dependent acetolactate synthase large subunit-like protein
MKTVAEYLLEMRVAGYEDLGVDVKKTNFAKVAEAVGIRGIRVENSGDLKSSLEDALRHEGPVLVDVGSQCAGHATEDRCQGSRWLRPLSCQTDLAWTIIRVD